LLVGDPIEPYPQQIHLSVTTHHDEMVVMWVTSGQDLPPTVQYGLQSGKYDSSTTGTAATYDVGVDGWDGWISQVKLTGLSLNTKYYYRVGTPTTYWSDEFSFTTTKADADVPTSRDVIAVVADQGTYIPMGFEVINQMVAFHAQDPFSLVVHAGDVCYAGTGDDWEFEEVWDVWEDLVQPIAANVPYMFAVGNHEHYYNYTAFDTRFKLPGDECGGNGNFWYSIDYGNAHYQFFSTEQPFQPGSVQYQWMEQDLINAVKNRNLRPWIILLGHRPMYSTDVGEWVDHRPGGRIQSELEPLFLKYGVDLYLCGHQHMYERVYPNINGTVVATGNVYTNPKATAHVNQATAGVFLDDQYITPQPDWSASRINEWGFGKMILNHTHLNYQFWKESDYQIYDEFWIIKD